MMQRRAARLLILCSLIVLLSNFAVADAEEQYDVESDESSTGTFFAGRGRTALSFDGKDDFGFLHSCQALPQSTVTVSAWVWIEKHKENNRIVTHKWVGYGWALFVDGSGVLRFGVGVNHVDYVAGIYLPQRRWSHVAGVYDGHVVRVYVNGEPGTAVGLVGASLDNEGFVEIGGAAFDPLLGQLENVAVWSVARSHAQIEDEILTGLSGTEPGLIALWKFDEDEGSTIYDASPVHNHAFIGDAERAPRRSQSDAPIETLCAERSGDTLNVVLYSSEQGHDGDEDAPPVSYSVSVLPDEGMLTRYDGLPLSEGSSIVPGGMVPYLLYEPPDSGDSESSCLSLKYRAERNGVKSTETVISIDLLQRGMSCSGRTLANSPCWAGRSRDEYVQNRQLTPLVSVIVPLYNQGHFLWETVDSVLKQTMTDWEMIIVNDGSTDDSLSVARTICNVADALNGRIRLIDKPNGGLADARNAGIAAASTEWVLPLDSDDIIDPHFLEEALAIIRSDGDTNLVISDLQGYGQTNYRWNPPEYSAANLPFTNMFHCSALFKKSIWSSVLGGYPTTTLFGYEDWAFWIAAENSHGLEPRYIRKTMFHYRIRRDGMHQTLLQAKNQEYSLASVRILFPFLYPIDVLLAAHDTLRNATDQVRVNIDRMLSRFSSSSSFHAHLMRGLVLEGAGRMTEAINAYDTALQMGPRSDWQPLLCKALALQKEGREEEATFHFEILRARFRINVPLIVSA